MDNETINKILKAGWAEIDNDINMHEEIRAVAKELANRLMWEGKVEEYIDNECGEEEPYVFVYDGQGIDRITGTPIVSVFVINVHHMEEASKIEGKQYRPAKYSAPLEGQFTREETVQTLMTAAISTIKGTILIDELDDENDQ